MKTCGRCGIEVEDRDAEFCFWCYGPLCYACWEMHGHCGEPGARKAARKAAAWQPGDPVMRAPWGGGPL